MHLKAQECIIWFPWPHQWTSVSLCTGAYSICKTAKYLTTDKSAILQRQEYPQMTWVYCQKLYSMPRMKRTIFTIRHITCDGNWRRVFIHLQRKLMFMNLYGHYFIPDWLCQIYGSSFPPHKKTCFCKLWHKSKLSIKVEINNNYYA